MNFVSRLRAEVLAARALPARSSGPVSGLYMAICVFSAGGVIFSGALAPFLLQGAGTVLFGTFVVCLVFTLTSGYRDAIPALPSPAVSAAWSRSRPSSPRAILPFNRLG